MDKFTIGKRIPIGGIVGGLAGVAIWYWNATHAPELQIPADVAAGATTALIAAVQLIIVNVFGVTPPAGKE